MEETWREERGEYQRPLQLNTPGWSFWAPSLPFGHNLPPTAAVEEDADDVSDDSPMPPLEEVSSIDTTNWNACQCPYGCYGKIRPEVWDDGFLLCECCIWSHRRYFTNAMELPLSRGKYAVFCYGIASRVMEGMCDCRGGENHCYKFFGYGSQ